MKEILRVLKPRACFFCLEASRPWAPIRLLYYAFCRYMVPRLGAWVTRVPEAYDYLVESIVDFPDREEIKSLFESVGFTDVRYRSLRLGIACIHIQDQASIAGRVTDLVMCYARSRDKLWIPIFAESRKTLLP